MINIMIATLPGIALSKFWDMVNNNFKTKVKSKNCQIIFQTILVQLIIAHCIQATGILIRLTKMIFLQINRLSC